MNDIPSRDDGLPTLGLSLIVKDEEDNLPHLLTSIEGAFDRVVLVDTGSTDRTVEVFEKWASREVGEGRLLSYLSDRFTWCEDFSAPRRYADSMQGCDWVSWADADDTVTGAANLRALAAQAPEDLVAFIAGYRYAVDAAGNTTCYLKRERLVRAGHGTWEGRVHEAQVIDGAATMVGPETVEWVHRKNPDAVDPGRNMRILESWEQEEPTNPRVLGYLGTEELARGNPAKAVEWFVKYLTLDPGWDEERAQVHRKLAIARGLQGDDDGATAAALEAMVLLPTWPDSYLTLAEASYRQGQLGKAVYWADQVLDRGAPDTLLIVNPLDYHIQPKVVKAGALAQLGDLTQAVALGEEVLSIVPDHPLRETWATWRGQLKRRSTADTFISCAQILCAHDEQLKARAVLDAVPHYATDDPQVVAWRSMLRERLDPLFNPDGYRAHYEDASQPEDMVPDDRVLELGDGLPRCAFLLAGLKAQRPPVAA